MSSLVIPNAIAPNTPRTAEPLAANFTAIQTWANGNIGSDNIGRLGELNYGVGSISAAAIKVGGITPALIASSMFLGYKTAANNPSAAPAANTTYDAQATLVEYTAPSAVTLIFLASLQVQNTGPIRHLMLSVWNGTTAELGQTTATYMASGNLFHNAILFSCIDLAAGAKITPNLRYRSEVGGAMPITGGLITAIAMPRGA